MALLKIELIANLIKGLKDTTVNKAGKQHILTSAWNMGIVDFNERKRLAKEYIKD